MMSRIGRNIIAYGCIVLLLCPPAASRAASVAARGVWVSVFSKKNVHFSAQAVNELVSFCEETGINEIYLQVFQSGRCYYDSSTGDRQKYELMLEKAGSDPLDLLLRKAHERRIKVFAWVNILSVGQNRSAHIITRFGRGVLTRDQKGRNSFRGDSGAEDTCYLQENQLFLEPGDPRVREYMLAVIAEIITRYPSLDGIHLDYIRYPASVPFTPGSRFNAFGLTYGYGERSVRRFQQASGLDPRKPLGNNREYLAWDNWKRRQITGIVDDVSRLLRERMPRALLSCAVMSIPDRAYESAFQDWPLWLKEGLVDYVVLMNYTLDTELFEHNVRCGRALRGKGRVYAGIGAFLFENQPGMVVEQYERALAAGCPGVVFFAYDSLDEELLKQLE
ncbi:MAG: family 10 glycosylhydrolase [Candidatus Omnitrophica bacterium]|nr:family 10 glycosylhydrolase [Candidatus Omnitrophota bacterium]